MNSNDCARPGGPPDGPKARRRPKGRRRPEREPDRTTLAGLLARLGIGSWDFVIVGDGSGSGYHSEAGWAAVSVERATGERLVWDGAVNRGTVNFAEVMAY